MKKIAIKANMGQMNGLSYHRLIIPYQYVSDLSEFQCDVFPEIALLPDSKLKEYSAVVFQREIDIHGRSTQLIQRLHNLGVKVIFDIDDYWMLPGNHHLYKTYNAHNIAKQTIELIKHVDLITVTTKHLAEKIRNHTTKPVEVLPNCLDLSNDQWTPNKVPSEHVRFGYVAGVHHVSDVNLLQKPIQKALFAESKTAFVLGGYTDNDHYKQYERVLSVGGMAKDRYKRITALDVNNYGRAYNLTDVSLIPLVSNEFSACKSEIKLLEAGAHGNAAIVSDVKPYNIFPKSSCVFVENHDTNGWYRAIKRLATEDNYRKEKAEELSLYVKSEYDLNKWTKTRKEILRHVLA